MNDTLKIYCNLQELQSIQAPDDYLFCNYGWKHHPAFQNIMVLEFPNTENSEAYGVHHELRKLHLTSLTRNWS